MGKLCRCEWGHWGLHDEGCTDRPSLTLVESPVAAPSTAPATKWVPKVGQVVYDSSRTLCVILKIESGPNPMALVGYGSELTARVSSLTLTDASHRWVNKGTILRLLPVRAEALRSYKFWPLRLEVRDVDGQKLGPRSFDKASHMASARSYRFLDE